MKEKILEALKTKFDGVKEDILDRIAQKAAKTVKSEDEMTTYLEGVTFQSMLEAYGDSRATDAQKTAVANYERKYNIKEGKPLEKEPEPKAKEPEPQAKEDETPAWAKAMMAEIAQLKGEKVANSRKAQLEGIIDGLPEKLKAKYAKDFERLTFKDDEDFSAWLEDSKADIEGIKADYMVKGGIITPPKKATAAMKGEVNSALKAQVEASKAAPAQGATATILGMPTT